MSGYRGLNLPGVTSIDQLHEICCVCMSSAGTLSNVEYCLHVNNEKSTIFNAWT